MKGKKVQILFGKSRVHYDKETGSNWQKPRHFLTRGSRKGPLHGDCTDTTNLMVSVLQAKGYTARGVFGYKDGDLKQPHAWGEVVIGKNVYFVDDTGGLMPLDKARELYNYKVPTDPSDRRYKSTWDGETQEVYDPTWYKKHIAKRIGDKPLVVLTPGKTPGKRIGDKPLKLLTPSVPTGRGRWKMVAPINHPKKIHPHKCYDTKVSGGEGRVTLNIGNLCIKPRGSFSGTVTWSRPPSVLVPGQKIAIQGQAKVNKRDPRFSQGTHLTVKADYTNVPCGYIKAGAKIGYIAVGKYTKSANLNTTFKVPKHGFAGSATSGKFGLYFCAPHYNFAYVYKWVP